MLAGILIYVVGVIVAYVGGMNRLESLSERQRARGAEKKTKIASIGSWVAVGVLVWVILLEKSK